MVTDLSNTRISARLRIVDEHVRMENQHDLDGIMGNFGETARYDDEPWRAHYTGRDQVHIFYAELLRALPDLQIEIVNCHACEDAIVLAAVITGHHMGTWRGLPATGWRIQFPLCAIFTFDAADRLAGEKIYYDRATVLRQLGIFHEPDLTPF
jgi:steroid delta-isomerase-like uncharacterized protein